MKTPPILIAAAACLFSSIASAVECMDFESFDAPENFPVGSTITENNISGTILPGIRPDGTIATGGYARVIESPQGSGNNRFFLSNTTVCYDLGCGDNISFSYTNAGGYVNILIDGDGIQVAGLSNGNYTIGGANVNVAGSTITVTMLTSGVETICLGGQEFIMDDFCYEPCENDSCFDFENLGTKEIPAGEGFIEDGHQVTITPFLDNPGSASSSDTGNAGHFGNEVYLKHAVMNFSFDCASGLMLNYAQTEAGVEICINGEMVIEESFTDLDGTTVGGVLVEIKGGASGKITLTGFITQFSIGGTDIYVDHLCPMPCIMDCIDFEGETVDAVFPFGSTIREDEIDLEVGGFEGEKGDAIIRDEGNAGHQGQDVELAKASLSIGIDCAESIMLHFGQYEKGIELEINGEFISVISLSELDGVELGGVDLEVVHDVVTNDGIRGVLTATGLIQKFTIGGARLFVDHICIEACPDPDCVDFELFPFTGTYPVGTTLNEEMTSLTVTPFQGINGTLSISGDNLAGHLGNEATLTNAGIDVRYVCAESVQFNFRIVSGNIGLSINGESAIAANFAALDGQTLGGVVIDANVVSSGRVYFTGMVQSLVISGEDLRVDRICYEPCDDLGMCIDFEELPAAGTWTISEQFTEDGTTMRNYLLFDEDFNLINIDGNLETANQQRAGFSGQDLEFNEAVVEFEFAVPCVENLSLNYGEYSGLVNLSINGDTIVAEDLYDLNGTTIGGRSVFVTRVPVTGGVIGMLRVDGPVTDLSIGGVNFFIDHVCFEECDPIVLGELILVSSEPISASQRETTMKVHVTGPATLRLQESTDLGQDDNWSTVSPATFTPIPGQPDWYETSAIYPLVDPQHFFRVFAGY